jgi:hypothetical protein
MIGSCICTGNDMPDTVNVQVQSHVLYAAKTAMANGGGGVLGWAWHVRKALG